MVVPYNLQSVPTFHFLLKHMFCLQIYSLHNVNWESCFHLAFYAYINFFQGSPKFLDFTGCTVYFEWETDILCKDMHPKAQVPCYLYNGDDRYDLSPLALTRGGYLVSSEQDTDVYINVCRDINAGKQNEKKHRREKSLHRKIKIHTYLVSRNVPFVYPTRNSWVSSFK